MLTKCRTYVSCGSGTLFALDTTTTPWGGGEQGWKIINMQELHMLSNKYFSGLMRKHHICSNVHYIQPLICQQRCSVECGFTVRQLSCLSFKNTCRHVKNLKRVCQSADRNMRLPVALLQSHSILRSQHINCKWLK